MLDKRHLWMDTVQNLQAIRLAEKRLKNNPASECVYGSWEIFGVNEDKEEEEDDEVYL